MGNRAVVCFANEREVAQYRDKRKGELNLSGFVAANPNKVGVYLHWNGGLDSVRAFCHACKLLGYRGGASDDYGVARFVQTACNFFGEDRLCVGVDTLEHLDTNNFDNGVYVVNDDWTVIGREFHSGAEQEEYDSAEFADKLVQIAKRLGKVRHEIIFG